MGRIKIGLALACVVVGLVVVSCLFLKPEISVIDRLLLREKRMVKCGPGPCHRGEYLSEGHCHSCPPETFIDANYMHGCKECRPCSQPDEVLGTVVKKQCTDISDTVLGCGPRNVYYQVPSSSKSDVKCLKCQRCGKDEVVEQPCTEYTDTVCRNSTSPEDGTDQKNSTAHGDNNNSTKKKSTPLPDTPAQRTDPMDSPTGDSSSGTSANADDKVDEHLGKGLAIGIPTVVVAIIVIVIVIIVRKKVCGRKKYQSVEMKGINID